MNNGDGLRLPQLVGDNMILQRDRSNKIWGYIEEGKKVTIKFVDEVYETEGNSEGKWEVYLKPLCDIGPYTMEICGEKTIVIHNILIGDLWICGGQSNMELPVARVMELYRDEVNQYENSFIRMFRVPTVYDFEHPKEELIDGYWQILKKENVLDFTALGYFFAKELFERYQVPIGLISTALGGTPAEAWISEDSLKVMPEYIAQVAKYKDKGYINELLHKDSERISAWMKQLDELDKGLNEETSKWFHRDFNDKEWKAMNIPYLWKKAEMDLDAGVIWLRKKVNISMDPTYKKSRILLGTIVDSDTVYINGEKIGETGYQYPPRIYDIPKGVLKRGENLIAIRIVCWQGYGGVTPGKPCRIEIDDGHIDLQGQWLYKVGVGENIEALAPQIFVQYEPTGVFNGMIAPLRNLSPKGVIWYQGESNASRKPNQYKQLFEMLIKDWRRLWDNEELPFIYVQLPNFKNEECEYSTWAEIREAQLQTLEIPHTGMAVTIDVGEWNDLHPLNKKTIGQRLALIARKIVYHEDIVYSGPVFKEALVENNQVILSFEHIGSGLVAEGGSLGGFLISENGKDFVPANALIEGNKVIVWEDSIKAPIEIRYGWEDNPKQANLYNLEALPASPFKFDWDKIRMGSTEGKPLCHIKETTQLTELCQRRRELRVP